MPMELVFIVCFCLLAYTYVGYFLLLGVLGPIVRAVRRPRAADCADASLPSVSMVLSLHNEEKHIAHRIDNFEKLAYPPEKLELMLGDDCSSDRTREIIRDRMARNPRIRFFPFDTHQGKTAVINQLVPQARGEVIAFTDANTFYAAEALRAMARHFANPRVGAVCGRLVLSNESGLNTDDQYWQFETMIKMRENDLGVVLGANGGIYALRKSLFDPLQSNVIQIDDFIWPVRVYEKEHHAVYEPTAVATEESSPHVEAEFRRKVRIGTGAYRGLIECWRLLLPWRGWISFTFWSHKVLRWFAPFLLIVLLVSNAFLLDRPVYRILFYLQVALYGSALVGWLFSRQKHVFARLFRVPYYFLGSNLALLVGFFKCVTGLQKATWSQKAHRA